MEKNKSMPNWKQLIPVYGLGKMISDIAEHEPSLIGIVNEDYQLVTGMAVQLYHVGTVIAALYGLEKFLQ